MLKWMNMSIFIQSPSASMSDSQTIGLVHSVHFWSSMFWLFTDRMLHSDSKHRLVKNPFNYKIHSPCKIHSITKHNYLEDLFTNKICSLSSKTVIPSWPQHCLSDFKIPIWRLELFSIALQNHFFVFYQPYVLDSHRNTCWHSLHTSINVSLLLLISIWQCIRRLCSIVRTWRSQQVWVNKVQRSVSVMSLPCKRVTHEDTTNSTICVVTTYTHIPYPWPLFIV